MKKAYVCLGSNMGNSEEYLSMARRALGEIPGVLCARISSLYRTEPQGRKDQPWFLNQVVMLLCEDMDPEFLLEEMLAAETRIGRTRDAGDRFGPRVIDMDLLLFDDCVRNENTRLVLPHPRMHERAFVLLPLLEIAPDAALPDGRKCVDFLSQLDFRVEDYRIYQ